MTMTPGLRKFALIVHVISSVSWLGAVFTYLALAITTQTSQDAQMVRAAYLALEPVTEYVLIPLSFASLLTGLIMSLGTQWGLFRHYWVIFKVLLTSLATLILLGFTQTMSRMVGAASYLTTSITDLRAMGAGMEHAVSALVVLLLIMILSVYKPQGMTRYGWRKQQEQRKEQTMDKKRIALVMIIIVVIMVVGVLISKFGNDLVNRLMEMHSGSFRGH